MRDHDRRRRPRPRRPRCARTPAVAPPCPCLRWVKGGRLRSLLPPHCLCRKGVCITTTPAFATHEPPLLKSPSLRRDLFALARLRQVPPPLRGGDRRGPRARGGCADRRGDRRERVGWWEWASRTSRKKGGGTTGAGGRSVPGVRGIRWDWESLGKGGARHRPLRWATSTRAGGRNVREIRCTRGTTNCSRSGESSCVLRGVRHTRRACHAAASRY